MTYCPTDLDSFVGQRRTVDRLRVIVEGALLSNNRRPPHILLAGPPGTGKAALAHAFAGSLGEPLHIITLPRPAPAVEGVLRSTQGVCLLERLHEAPRAHLAHLATLLHYHRATMAPVVATTSEADRIGPELLGQFLVPMWEPYSPDEIAAIAGAVAAADGVILGDEVLAGIGRAARGRPGNAAALVAAAGQLLDAELPIDLDAVLSQAGYARDGLTDAHFDFLAVLACCETATPRLLATALRLHPSVIAELERTLVDDGLVGHVGTSRRITKAGVARLTSQEAAA